jgi:phage terminase large subunit GpA-like protein
MARSQARQPPKLTLSQWADAYLMLSAEDASEPGKYSTSRAPYQRGILDAISDPSVSEVVIMSSAQVGKTLIAKAALGYYIDQDPAPILIVQPTIEMSETFSKDRLAPMVRDTPALRGKIADPRSRDSGNTILHKRFPGGHLTMVGANAPAGLASRPIRVVICDEVDRYPASAGTEGDPVSLAKARTKTFHNRKLVLMSTPGDEATSRIAPAFEASDQRHYLVPCHDCGHMQRLRWSQVRWDEGDASTARYECEQCEARWTDGQRIDALGAGQWVATFPDRLVAGFHLSEFYSPFRMLWQIVAEFLAAKVSAETLKTWTNTSLGEVWKDSGGDRRQPELLARRREAYDCSDSQDVPQGVVWIDAGVDTQDDRLECEIVGWGIGEESWGLDHVVIEGSPDTPEVWARLEDQLARMFVREDGARLPVSLMLIDSGGHHTTRVYEFARKNRRARACVGRSGQRAEVTRPSKQTNGKMTPWVIGVDQLKSQLLQSRLLVEAPGPRYCHFPDTYSDRWFEQLCAETAVTKYRHGVPYVVWDAGKRRNEALDCRVLAMAGVRMDRPNLEMLHARLLTEAAIRSTGEQPVAPAPRKRRVIQSQYMSR